ncbi:hypothetical protein V6N13_073952 [Hibiscus sabdariffa]|uniref:Uncharacterized protein n=1 Tax=Hibiscus sabdariffa TaxID=183260 RepID=A0ABR2U7B4_9ROSI
MLVKPPSSPCIVVSSIVVSLFRCVLVVAIVMLSSLKSSRSRHYGCASLAATILISFFAATDGVDSGNLNLLAFANWVELCGMVK